MKKRIQSLYQKYGIKAVILLGTWWIIKWSAFVFFGNELLEWLR